MWSLGFGLELIGVLVLRNPVVSSIVVLITVIAAIFGITSLQFNGNITAVLPEQSKAFQDYDRQKERYRDFSSDVFVVIQSDRLFTASGLEDLRFLQLELAVTEGVSTVTSVLSVPSVDRETGEFSTYFPEVIESDEQAKALVERLVSDQPQIGSLVSVENNAAMLLVTLDTSIQEDDEIASASYFIMREALKEAAPEDFEITVTGLTSVGVTVVSALVNDQVKLTVFGLLLGTGIAFYVFRSLVAALICALPPALTVLWCLGVFVATGTPVNFLTTVLPTLALILAFADGIVLYFKWQRSNAHNADLRENLFAAIRRVGPASSLTSITTAIAFYSFSLSDSGALQEFSYMGVACVLLAFLSVMSGLPLGIHWAMKMGLMREGRAVNSSFAKLGTLFSFLASGKPLWVFIGAIAVVIGLVFVHLSIKAEYRVTDYLPHDSETRKGEQLTNDLFGGRSTIFLSVPVANSERLFGPENRARLLEVEQMLGRLFDEKTVFSIRSVWEEFEDEAMLQRALDQLEEQGVSTGRSYVSQDGDRLLVGVRIPSNQSISLTLEELEKIRTNLAGMEFGADVVISGFPVLMAEEFTRLIEQLRQSLILAIFLGVIIVGIATRSPLLALAALTPNLLPVLAVELVLFIRGGVINLSEVIALTVAFGIAIDNAVHVINIYSAETRSGRPRYDSVMFAVREVGPALGASTLIICVAILVTQISALPTVPILGQLMIATLLVALVANLAILPANILTLERLRKRLYS